MQNGKAKATKAELLAQIELLQKQKENLEKANSEYVGEHYKIQVKLQEANRSSAHWQTRFFTLLRLSEKFLEDIPLDPYAPVGSSVMNLSLTTEGNQVKGWNNFWTPKPPKEAATEAK